MRVELQWALVEADIPNGQPCDLCEVEFKGKAVIIRVDPHGFEACEECLRALCQRKNQDSSVPWPTWAEYQALVESHPKPMFSSTEEMEASEPEPREFPYWPAFDNSFLWRPAPREAAPAGS